MELEDGPRARRTEDGMFTRWGWLVPIVVGCLFFPPHVALASESPQDQVGNGRIIVYLIDHQYLRPDELATIRNEIDVIFADAGLDVDWQINRSPRRLLKINELRVIVLPSDGTRWFYGPSNVIGLAPHDEFGVGRNCWVFYRQALWFRQQAVLRCREATRARAQASARGEELDASYDALAPASCAQFLPALTPLIVARAAAHEMVHILLNKLDHSPKGLMRDTFHIQEWLVQDASFFQLGDAEVAALKVLSTSNSNTERPSANSKGVR